MNLDCLFVDIEPRRCGVSEFGQRYCNALVRHGTMHWTILRTMDPSLVVSVINSGIYDVVVVNAHPELWPALADRERLRPDVLVAAIKHDTLAGGPDIVLWPDPTASDTDFIYNIGRLIPQSSSHIPEHSDIVKIGTAGLAYERKLLGELLSLVDRSFETYSLRLHLTRGDYVGDNIPQVMRDIELAQANLRPGCSIELFSEYVPSDGLISFLASNDINVFLYSRENVGSMGVSSVTDIAIAAGKPIAVNDSPMFRHILQLFPEMNVDQFPLQDILGRGPGAVQELQTRWSETAAVSILETHIRRTRWQRCPINRFLLDGERAQYATTIEHMRQTVPDVMARKIDRANVQQAFVYDIVKRYRNVPMLCVGCYDDTVYETLKTEGYSVTGIDPSVNTDLATFRKGNHDRYPVVFSVSVIEHVENDEQFLTDLCSLLDTHGLGVITMDAIPDGFATALPVSDYRLYTPNDIATRLSRVISAAGCRVIGRICYEGTPDFHFFNSSYCFATLVFEKER